MKFIVDAQLPRRLSNFLNAEGHDSIHTLDLPQKNDTEDIDISNLSIKEKRIVISKDSDFYNSFLQKSEPYKLIYLTTGSIPNNELLSIFEKNGERIFEEISTNFVVEISRTSIITIL